LSEAEAAARRPEGQESDSELEASRSRGEIWRENVLTILNLDLLGMAIVLWLLGDPLGALGGLGVMCLNIGLNVGQELLVEKKLAQLALTTRPTATVIREGKVRSIDPGEIVVEDVLVVGPGDRVLVEGEIIGAGQIVVDESMLTGKGYRLSRRAGDMLHAGSFCVAGRAAYEAREVSAERLIEVSTGGAQRSKRELTPLEQIMNRILQVLLLIVACLSTLLLVQFFRSDLVILNDFYRNAISIIFSIAPSSLFFMIVVTYAVGTADMAKLGALVRRAQSIESLAQVSVLCFSKTGILTGMRVSLETVDPPAQQDPGRYLCWRPPSGARRSAISVGVWLERYRL
jgi:cation-transporting ATPase E